MLFYPSMDETKQKLFMGNWKMHGDRAFCRDLAASIVAHFRLHPSTHNIALCPTTIWLDTVQEQLVGSNVLLGAQDCSSEQEGAHTGETSPAALKSIGCVYSIVGHSERRSLHGEISEQVRAKAEALLKLDIIPVICVGETLAERESGDAERIVCEQLIASLPQSQGLFVVAYEPVWAIGTGHTPNSGQIETMHEAIHTTLTKEKGDDFTASVLYGGSVKPQNAAEILTIKGVDGALIGGASLKVESFIEICEAV